MQRVSCLGTIYAVVHFEVNNSSYKTLLSKNMKPFVNLERFVPSFKSTVEKE